MRISTERERRGAAAESAAAVYVMRLGWRVLARNVRIDRVEIDLVAIDPGPPPALVVVEVRSLAAAGFGVPEERVDRTKVARLYRALSALRSLGLAPDVARLPRRVDLIAIDRTSGKTVIRHLRSLEPP